MALASQNCQMRAGPTFTRAFTSNSLRKTTFAPLIGEDWCKLGQFAVSAVGLVLGDCLVQGGDRFFFHLPLLQGHVWVAPMCATPSFWLSR